LTDDLDKKTTKAQVYISVITNLMELFSVIILVTTGRATQSNATAIIFNGYFIIYRKYHQENHAQREADHFHQSPPMRHRYQLGLDNFSVDCSTFFFPQLHFRKSYIVIKIREFYKSLC
jgi:hypothetical protein